MSELTTPVPHPTPGNSDTGAAGTVSLWTGVVGATQSRPGLCRQPTSALPLDTYAPSSASTARQSRVGQ